LKATANVVIERHLKLNQLHLTILKGDPGKVAARGKRITHTPCGAWCTDVVGIENKRMQSICQRLCSGIGGYGTVTRPYICMYAMSAFRPSVRLSVRTAFPSSIRARPFIHPFVRLSSHTYAGNLCVVWVSGLFAFAFEGKPAKQ